MHRIAQQHRSNRLSKAFIWVPIQRSALHAFHWSVVLNDDTLYPRDHRYWQVAHSSDLTVDHVGSQTCTSISTSLVVVNARNNETHFVPSHAAVLRPIDHPYMCIPSLSFVTMETTDFAVAWASLRQGRERLIVLRSAIKSLLIVGRTQSLSLTNLTYCSGALMAAHGQGIYHERASPDHLTPSPLDPPPAPVAQPFEPFTISTSRVQ